MLSKCANSSCSNPFLYLHNGKLFRMDVVIESESPRSSGRRPSRRAEFFWLCNECAATLTLSYRDDVGVVTIPLKRARAAADQG